jgi:hypothetical protein
MAEPIIDPNQPPVAAPLAVYVPQLLNSNMVPAKTIKPFFIIVTF